MKALVWHGPHQLQWQDWPNPEARTGEVVVAVGAVGVCGSDLRGYTGETGRRVAPMIMGHEGAGEVVAVGAGVDRGWLGKRVLLYPTIPCRTCVWCQVGRTNLCQNRRIVGARSTNGAMAERVVVPEANLRPLPDTMSFVQGALVEPLAVGIHASKRAGDLRGQSVLIIGSGSIGLLTLVAALQSGAACVVTADLIPKRRATARALGAAAALDPTDDGWKQHLAGVVGSPAVDVAVDAVGTPDAFELAVAGVGPAGTVVAIGGWRPVPLDLDRLMHLELEVKGTFGFISKEFDESLRWLEERRFDVDQVITDVLPLSQGPTVFADLVAGRRPETIKSVLIPD